MSASRHAVPARPFVVEDDPSGAQSHLAADAPIAGDAPSANVNVSPKSPRSTRRTATSASAPTAICPNSGLLTCVAGFVVD